MLKELRKDKWGENVFVMMLTNVEPTSDLINEAERFPYVSSYHVKSDTAIDEVLNMVEERFKKKAIKNGGK